MSGSNIIRVRYCCGTHSAAFRGCRASSTGSAEWAAEAVARKALGERFCWLTKAGPDKYLVVEREGEE